MSYGMQGPTGSFGNTSTGGLREKIPSGYRKGSLQQFTPEQMQLFQQSFQNVGPESYLSRLAGGDQGLFDEIEAPALRQFSGLQGNIASRFSGMGLGGRHSSGFQNTTNQAASSFAQDLASRRMDLRNQALRDLMGMSHQLLGERPFEQFLVKKEHKQPFWKKLLGQVSPIGGDIAEGGTNNTQNFFKMLSSMQGGGF